MYLTFYKLNVVTYGFIFLLQDILNFELDFGQTIFFVYFTLSHLIESTFETNKVKMVFKPTSY
jgi:hypothetical protein